MEMASAHGLALKLVEMDRLDRIHRNELCEIISEEDKIIKLWYIASQSRFSKKNFFNLMRKTIVFVLSPNSLKEVKKKELLKGASMYFNQFSSVLKNSLDIRKPFIGVILDPWENKHFSWEELFQKKINICDLKVQQYFEAEPEEIVLARVHFFSITGKDELSMVLSKNSFLYHCRIIKSFKYLAKSSDTILNCHMSRKGIPSMDWYIHNLRRRRNLNAVFNELKQLTCDEGVLLLMRMRGLKYLQFALSVVEIFIMLELIRHSKFCCTKKLFTLWAILYKDMATPIEVVNEDIKKMIAVYAPSSSYFYLLVDAFWEQFGMSFVNIYVELYIRALTTDLNLLEVAKHQNRHEDLDYLESHMSSMFFKLSTLFIEYHQRVARECMFSAFSLRPTKKILYILQSMTHSILSEENEMKCDSSFNHSNTSVQECKCAIKCTGFCKSIKEHVLDHPILMKGIPNIPYSVVKDLVSVLESVRCFRFQYNVFNWLKNTIDLNDYLRDFTLSKSYESDTECEDDNVPVPEQKSQSEKINTTVQSAVKRKSDASDLKDIFPFEMIGANIEVRNEELVNKRMRIEDQSQNIISSTKDILNTEAEPSQTFTFNVGMEDAIENVIRETLDKDKQNTGSSLDKPRVTFPNESCRQNDRSENLPSLYKTISENRIYPYSLSNYGKEKNLNPSTTFRSEVESSLKYNYVPPSTSVLSRALTAPIINHGRVISPTHHLQKSTNSIQEQSFRQINQNKYLLKPVNDPFYNKSKDNQTDINSEKKLVYQQQEAHNFSSKSSLYQQNSHVSNPVSHSSQYIANHTTMQIAHRSSITPDFPKEQFLKNIPIHSTNSVTSPLNLTQPKPSTVKISQFSPVSHHQVTKTPSILRTDSRYHTVDTVSKTVVKRVNESMHFQDNQLVHCDRSSVIQHTMQHIKENNSQIGVSEVEMPNQLAVSVNSDAVEQIRNVPKEDITNLPPFRVNISDRSIPSSSLAVRGSLVIARKPRPQVEIQSQPVANNSLSVASDIITIPGVLASPSVIVSPWEAQRKVHGEMLYKKTPGITASNIDKRIYKNRPPYGRPVAVKPESKILAQRLAFDKNNNSQIFKALAMASHNNPNVHTIPSANQSNTNASRNWVTVNKSSTSSSSQVVSQTTTSQPWYSEPYPKPHASRNASSTSTGSSTVVSKSAVQLFQPGNDPKTFTVYSKQIHLSKSQTTAIPAISSSLPHSSNNPTSDSSVKPNVHFVATFSVSAPSVTNATVTNTAVGNIVPSSSNSNAANIKTYSSAHTVAKNNSVASSTQVSDRSQIGSELALDKNSATYSASNIIDNSLQFSHGSPRTLQNSCCSPTELNPCQNCSLPSENNLVQTSDEKTLNDHPNNMIPRREKMVFENNAISAACNSNFLDLKEEKHQQSNMNLLNCPHCATPFPEIELQNHALNCASRNLDMNDGNLMNEIDSNMLITENFCSKPLPDVVPEQNTFFQKETFLNNLPQTAKSFMNMEDEKNFDDIDEIPFSSCMDLINNDKDLERIVQDIDSLDQIDNNYLPYIPPADPAENFLSNNLCNDIQNNNNPLQDSPAYDKINDGDDYNIYQGCPQLPEKKMSVFDFTETKSVQQPVFTKPQVSSIETIQTTASKISNELSFADILKGIITETSPIATESDAHCEFKSSDPGDLQIPELFIKNESNMNEAHISQGPSNAVESSVNQVNFTHAEKTIVQPNKIMEKTKTIRPKFSYKCLYCPKSYCNPTYVKRHIALVHQGSPIEYQRIRRVNNKNFKSKGLKSKNKNSYNNNNTDSFNNELNSNMNKKFPAPGVLENVSTLPKGRIKGVIKNRQTECKECGKVLTVIYLKRHMLSQHKVKTENSSDLNADVNESPTLDSSSVVDPTNIPSLSPSLEQDFDSSTCLSASDALKKNNSFSVTETSHNSENGCKSDEKTDVKFNFNVLEFSRDAESKITSEENPSLQTEKDLENRPLDNMQSFEDRNSFNDVLHTKPSKCYVQEHRCFICNKLYHSRGNLTRHLKSIHNEKMPQKSKRVIKSEHKKNIGADVKPLCVAEKEMPVPLSKELTKIEKIPNDSANSGKQIKMHDYSPRPNSKGNLLKAVLQSNFARKSKISKSSLIKDCKQINSTSQIQTSIKDKESLHSFTTHNVANNELPILTNLSDASLKDNSKIGGSLDSEHPHLSNSQNMTVHTCEISSVSQIISNVSKCHFGGTSNKDNKKEVFEDNSLKLPIPENKDSDSSVSPSHLEQVHESNKMQGNNYNQHNYNNMNSENSLNCDKNDSDLCSQLKDQEILHTKLNDTACFSGNSDISIEKPEKITSATSLNYEIKEKCTVAGISQENEPSVFEDASLEKEFKVSEFENDSCQLRNILLENQSSEIENILQENESYSLRNIVSDSQSCDIENVISENLLLSPKNIMPEHESCKLQNAISENESSEICENAIEKNYPCDLENSVQENKNSKCEDVVNKNESCDLENSLQMNKDNECENVLNKNEHCDLVNSLQENKDSKYEDILNTKPCDLENSLQENKDNESEDVSNENNFCDLENSLQENKGTKCEDILNENEVSDLENSVQDNKCDTCKNVLSESEPCDLDSSLQAEESCDSKSILQKSESSNNSILLESISELQTSLIKNQSCDSGENMPQNQVCESENTPQEEDSLQKNISHEIENDEEKRELCEFTNTLSNSNNIMCRLCQQNLDSMEILSKHLKDFHDIPLLKKHEHTSKNKSTHSQDIKLSPPNLKLGSNESDSESMSDFDSPQNCSKITNHTSPQAISKNKKLPGNNFLTLPSPTKQNVLEQETGIYNLPSVLEESPKQVEQSNKSSEAENKSDIPSLKSSVTCLNHQNVVTSVNKFRRHSFDDTYSVTPVNCADSNGHLKSKFYKNDKRKSISLPNVKIAFPSITPSQIECRVNSIKPLVIKKLYIESSFSDDASFSSINDSIENCKSSCDSSLSSSSSQNTVPLNEITINSNFILPNRMNSSVPRTSHKKILKSKLCGRKLIIQRFKSFKKKNKKKSKSKLFSHKKIRSAKTYKPIIVTLKEATEVDKFLETNKQPIVKLVRVDENCYLSNKKTSLISFVNCDKINMHPVVRLEKITVPNDDVPDENHLIENEAVIIEHSKRQFTPNLLQQDDHEFSRHHKTTKNSRKRYSTLRNRTVLPKISQTHSLSDESIEISDDSSDSVQFLQTISKKEKEMSKQTKPCSVVLENILLSNM